MKISSFLIADNALINPKTQKMNIEGIFGDIYTQSFPAVHNNLAVILIFEGQKKQYNYELILKYKQQKMTIQKIKTTGGKTGHAIITNVKQLPLMGSGTYIFEAKLDGRKVAEKEINVKQK